MSNTSMDEVVMMAVKVMRVRRNNIMLGIICWNPSRLGAASQTYSNVKKRELCRTAMTCHFAQDVIYVHGVVSSRGHKRLKNPRECGACAYEHQRSNLAMGSIWYFSGVLRERDDVRRGWEPASVVLVWLSRLLAKTRVGLSTFFSDQMRLRVRSVLFDSFPVQFLE